MHTHTHTYTHTITITITITNKTIRISNHEALAFLNISEINFLIKKHTNKNPMVEESWTPRSAEILRLQDRLPPLHTSAHIFGPRRNCTVPLDTDIGTYSCRYPRFWSVQDRTELAKKLPACKSHGGESWTLRSVDTLEKSEETTLCPQSRPKRESHSAKYTLWVHLPRSNQGQDPLIPAHT